MSMTTENTILALLEQGKTKAEIARQLGIFKSKVSYYAKKLGYGIPRAPMIDWKAVQAIYDTGLSVRETQKIISFSMKALDSAVKKGRFKYRPRQKRDIKILLVEDRPQTSRNHLKARLIEEGILKNVCNDCGMGTNWNGKLLVLHLDHINGKPKDNRLENLQLLCPNCHSQTHTYAGKNVKKHKDGTPFKDRRAVNRS